MALRPIMVESCTQKFVTELVKLKQDALVIKFQLQQAEQSQSDLFSSRRLLPSNDMSTTSSSTSNSNLSSPTLSPEPSQSRTVYFLRKNKESFTLFPSDTKEKTADLEQVYLEDVADDVTGSEFFYIKKNSQSTTLLPHDTKQGTTGLKKGRYIKVKLVDEDVDKQQATTTTDPQSAIQKTDRQAHVTTTSSTEIQDGDDHLDNFKHMVTTIIKTKTHFYGGGINGMRQIIDEFSRAVREEPAWFANAEDAQKKSLQGFISEHAYVVEAAALIDDLIKLISRKLIKISSKQTKTNLTINLQSLLKGEISSLEFLILKIREFIADTDLEQKITPLMISGIFTDKNIMMFNHNEWDFTPALNFTKFSALHQAAFEILMLDALSVTNQQNKEYLPVDHKRLFMSCVRYLMETVTKDSDRRNFPYVNGVLCGLLHGPDQSVAKILDVCAPESQVESIQGGKTQAVLLANAPPQESVSGWFLQCGAIFATQVLGNEASIFLKIRDAFKKSNDDSGTTFEVAEIKLLLAAVNQKMKPVLEAFGPKYFDSHVLLGGIEWSEQTRNLLMVEQPSEMTTLKA